MNLIKEISEWEDMIRITIGDNTELLHVSSSSSDIRIYRKGNRVLKIRKLTPATVTGRPNSLEDEFLVLQWLNRKAPAHILCPQAITYTNHPGWEQMEMTWVPPPASTDPVVAPYIETTQSLIRLAKVIWRLNRAGVSHGDIRPDNIGLNSAGQIVVLDFDQAASGHWLRCALRDFLGIPFLGRAAQITFLDRVMAHGWIKPLANRVESLRCKLRRRRNPDGGPYDWEARINARCSETLIGLRKAWRTAAISNANSPGAGIAYYSLDINGLHLPGERPWLQRWLVIAKTTDFQGKRVIELGCNMALLSCYARLSGARAALAADINADVLTAATELSKVLGVEIETQRVDFDNDVKWEELLGQGDIVTALSLTYWLKDKDRLWRYIAKFPEVIFEGHETVGEVEQRLRRAGFTKVTRIGLSERNRPIYHGMR